MQQYAPGNSFKQTYCFKTEFPLELMWIGYQMHYWDMKLIKISNQWHSNGLCSLYNAQGPRQSGWGGGGLLAVNEVYIYCCIATAFWGVWNWKAHHWSSPQEPQKTCYATVYKTYLSYHSTNVIALTIYYWKQ